jgi:hypothetical protein
MTKIREKKFGAEKKEIFLDKKLQLTYPLSSIKDVQVTEKPSALEREHPALQNMKFPNFFLLMWVIFVLLDPDSGSNLDPDPNYWISSEPAILK